LTFTVQLGKRFVNIFLVAATNDDVSSTDGQTLGYGEANYDLKKHGDRSVNGR
jgi:hypothetical protein